MEFFNLFLLFSALHGFLLCAVVFRRCKGKKEGALYVNLMILTLALNNLQSWLLVKGFPALNYIQVPWHFLTAPFFYAFLLDYLKVRESFFNILKVAIPFFLLSIVLQVVYLSIERTGSSATEYRLVYERYNAFEELVSFLTSLGIFAYSFYIVRFKRNLFNHILDFDNLKWLNNIIFLGWLTYVSWGCALTMRYYLRFENFIVFFYPLRVMTTLIIYWLGYKLLFIMKQAGERRKIRKDTHPVQRKKAPQAADKFQQIEGYIIKNQRFLDNQLSLESLAAEFRISCRQLSQIINDQTSQNFNHMINGYRVGFSKQLLLDPRYSDYAITSIALESGFNSKSAFYSAFKKHAGMTPSQFRDNNLSPTSGQSILLQTLVA